MPAKLTQDEFISRSNKIHNFKYDYSKTIYINRRTKIIIICPEHGEFFVLPKTHMDGHECIKCAMDKRILPIRLNNEIFISKAQKKFGNKFNYSKFIFTHNTTKSIIICPIHGEFLYSSREHLSTKFGCPKCAIDAHIKNTTMDLNDYIEKVSNIHNNKYDYSKTVYINANTKVCIICPVHGEFWQKAADHLYNEAGCPICSSSKGELSILKFLEDNHIKYSPQESFIDFKNPCINPETNYHLSFDFYLPDYNLVIEYQGKQHYMPIAHFGGKEKFINQQFKDNFKRQYCKENGIKLLEISYTNFPSINSILNKILVKK